VKQRKLIPIQDRLFSRVTKTKDCWLWNGGVVGHGYGYINRGRRGDGFVSTHRASWEIAYGEISEGMEVLHKCDNPACVNPEHLFLGSQKDNVDDMISKNRRRGGRLILTKEQVAEIRRMYETKEYSLHDLSLLFPVSKSQIFRIVSRENWK
jgi:hypothetical protein